MYLLFICVIIIFICLFLLSKNINEQFSPQINTKKLVDKIYVINLDRRKDRLKNIDTGLNKNKLEYERFSACDGKNIDKYKKDIEKYFDKDHKLTNGQIGCALSHIKIWEKILKNGTKNTLILEDDAIIPDNLLERINKLDIKKFDLLYLQLHQIICKKIKKNIYKPVKGDGNWGTTAYIINKNLIKRIINKKIKEPIDVHFSNFYNNNILLVYPNIIKPDYSSKSDLWGGIPNDLNMNETLNKIKIIEN